MLILFHEKNKGNESQSQVLFVLFLIVVSFVQVRAQERDIADGTGGWVDDFSSCSVTDFIGNATAFPPQKDNLYR